MILKILIGFALGYIAACVTFYILQKRERRRRKEKKKKVSLNTYAKVATTAVLAHGMILTSCSYVLSSIHYFSRQFKKITGMSPTEYTESVLQLASF